MTRCRACVPGDIKATWSLGIFNTGIETLGEHDSQGSIRLCSFRYFNGHTQDAGHPGAGHERRQETSPASIVRGSKVAGRGTSDRLRRRRPGAAPVAPHQLCDKQKSSWGTFRVRADNRFLSINVAMYGGSAWRSRIIRSRSRRGAGPSTSVAYECARDGDRAARMYPTEHFSWIEMMGRLRPGVSRPRRRQRWLLVSITGLPPTHDDRR